MSTETNTLTPVTSAGAHICSDCGRSYPSDTVFCPEDGALLAKGDSLIGQTLTGKYIIQKEMGVGGMCVVYEAKHVLTQKIVAIKVLRAHLAVDGQVVERFQQEAQVASRIHNPHAVNVTDFGMTPSGIPFMVMDLVQGITLSDLLRQFGALKVPRTAEILRQIAVALTEAHNEGVIHRDIKPENIIISEYDGRDWVTVMDFGIAKIQEDLNKRTNMTGENFMVGTPRYMSPEQAENQPIDGRTDIYSLGIVVYEMLAGKPPFDGDSATRLLMKQVAEPPPPLSELRPDISPEIETVVMRALSKDRELRQQSVAEFTSDFDAAAGIIKDQSPDRGGAFTRITVPIGEPRSDDGPVDSTLVRPVTNQTYSDTMPMPGQLSRNIVVRQEASPWPAVIIAVLILAVIGTVSYFYLIRGWTNSLLGAGEIGRAQQAVVDARARIESLPKDSALYREMPNLLQWQDELAGYAAATQKTPEMIDKSRDIADRATKLSESARKELVSAPKSSQNTSEPPAQETRPRVDPETLPTPDKTTEEKKNDKKADDPVVLPTNPKEDKPPAKTEKKDGEKPDPTKPPTPDVEPKKLPTPPKPPVKKPDPPPDGNPESALSFSF